MRIACPACNAAYQVPDDQLSEGRVVRCARCATDWAPLEAIPASDGETDRERAPPPVEAERAAAQPEPEPAVEPRRKAIEEDIPLPRPVALPQASRKRRGSLVLAIAWVLSLAVVGAAVAGLYVGRERVMKVWPPSVRAYAPLGLAGHTAQSEAQRPEEAHVPEAHVPEAHGPEAHGPEARGSEGRE